MCNRTREATTDRERGCGRGKPNTGSQGKPLATGNRITRVFRERQERQEPDVTVLGRSMWDSE